LKQLFRIFDNFVSLATHITQKMRHFALPAIFVFLFNLQLKAQDQITKETFVEAESFFLFEEYNEALPGYLKLLKASPNNDNLNYKIGICYLNNPYEKEKSIEYLLKASKNINPNYKENSIKETKAPYDALFYLGNAYRINNQLDEALGIYEKFKLNLDPKVYNIDLVDDQIKNCKYAMQKEKEPLDIVYKNLGENINTRFPDVNAVVTPDENIMVYVQQQQLQDFVFYTEKVNGVWQNPRNLAEELGLDVDTKVYPTSISSDGKELFLYGSDHYLGTIYSSTLVNGSWTKLKKLNDNINTKYWESHASISSDGKTLYFTSNRKGTYGGLDIYKSSRDSKGEWGPAVNLGPVINSKYNEETPFITEDGKTLYFSSYGHNSMGGYDVFYSNLLDDGTWSVPINAGYPINTPDDDVFYLPVKNGNFAYYSRYFEKDGYGKMDIYRYEIYSDIHPHKFQIKGAVSLKGIADAGFKGGTVSVYDRLKRDTIDRVNLNDKGEYSLSLNSGEYDLHFRLNGFLPRIERLVIPKDYKEGSLTLATALNAIEKQKTQQEKVPPPPSMFIKTKLINVQTDNPVRINIVFSRHGTLFIHASLDSATLINKIFELKEGPFTYSYSPKLGKNIIEFKHIDEDKNTTVDYVIVNFNQEKIETETTALTQQALLNGANNPVVLLEGLKKLATGAIKSTLDNLDLKKNKINSPAELIQYLMSHAVEGNYSTQDVIDLLTRKASNLSLQELVNVLANYANGDIKKALASVDFQKEDIRTASDLVDYLFKSADKFGYKRNDVLNLLVSGAAGSSSDTKDLLKKLIAYSGGNLQKYLLSLKLDSLKIKDNEKLIRLILANATKYGYTEKDVVDALLGILSAVPLDQFIRLMANYSEGNLKTVLENLNPSRENINSIPELIDWLLNQAPIRGYTKDDVLNALMKMAMASEDNVPGFIRVLQENSIGNFNDALKHINSAKLGLTTNASLVEYLIAHSLEKKYTKENVLSALSAIAYDGNPQDVLYELLRISDSKLKKKLARIDLFDQGLTDLPSLFSYIKSDLASKKMEDSTYRKLVTGYIASQQLNGEIERFKTLSTGNLRKYLIELDPAQYGLNSPRKLSEFLYSQSLKNGYNCMDLFNLLEHFRQSEYLDEMLKNALLLSEGNLHSSVAEFDPDLYQIYTKKAFADYLFIEAPRYQYNKGEVTDLLIKLLCNSFTSAESLKSALIKQKNGSINYYLSKLKLDKANIHTSRDLATNLLSAKSLNHNDLYSLLTSAVDQKETTDYLEYLKSLGEESIVSYVSGIDLKRNKIRTVESLIEIIRTALSKGDLDCKDAVLSMSSIQQFKNLHQFRLDLLKSSENELKASIDTIDLDKENIKSVPAFINELLRQASNKKSGEDIVFNALLKNASESELQRFIYRMSKASRGSLRNALLSLDTKELGLKSSQEIVQYLINVSAQNGYSEQDVINALTKVCSDLLDEILHRINYMDSLTHRGWMSKNGSAIITSGLLIFLFLLLLLSLRRSKRNKRS
jgi:hypothetical protein